MDIEKEKNRVLIIEQANLKLKKIINDSMMLGVHKDIAKQQCINLINETIKDLKELDKPKYDEEFYKSVENGLKTTFMSWYTQMANSLAKMAKNDKFGIIQKTIENMGISKKPVFEIKGGFSIAGIGKDVAAKQTSVSNLREFMTLYGTAEAGFYVDYYKQVRDNVLYVQEELSRGNLSAVDSKGRNKSIRNMAEIKTRYDLISEDLNKIKEKGNKYVVSTAHANASERCSWWQGKIFVIDLDVGSREMGQYPGHKPPMTIKGYIDGEPFYSLKEACENGFLSYNCRHRLVVYYKGIHIPKYDMITVDRQRNISLKQREYERRIREAKTQEQLLEGEERQKAIDKSKRLQNELNEFCKINNVPNYSWRTRISLEERGQVTTPASTPGSMSLQNKATDDIIEMQLLFVYKEAASIQEAEEYATKTLGIEKACYKGLDLKVANEMNQSFIDLLNYDSKAKEHLKFVGSAQERHKLLKKDLEEWAFNWYKDQCGDSYAESFLRKRASKWASKQVGRVDGQTLASAYRKSKLKNDELAAIYDKYIGIVVNNKYGKEYEEFLSTIKYCVEVKFHPEGTETVKAIIDHECGHIIDYEYGLRNNNEIQQLLDSYANNYEQLTNDLSEYAWNNTNKDKYAEFIAEAYTEYKNNSNCRELAAKVGKIIEKVVSKNAN